MQTPTIQPQSDTFSTAWLAAGAVMAIVLLAFVLLLTGFISFESREAPLPEPGLITLKTEKMAFGTQHIEVQAGALLTLQLENGDFVPHSFDIDELDIHVPVDVNGQVATVIEGLPAGRYEFYCGVPGHREAGMVGELVVID